MIKSYQKKHFPQRDDTGEKVHNQTKTGKKSTFAAQGEGTGLKEKAIAATRGACAIRRALVELLGEKAYSDITVGELIQRSAYSKSCFYQHYCDKLDVAEQTVQEEAALYVRMLIDQMRRHANVREEQMYYYQIALGTFRYIAQKQPFYRLLFRDKFPGMGLEYFCDLAADDFLRSTPFRPNTAYSPQALEMFYYCSTHMVMRRIRYWDLHDFSQTPEELAALTATLSGMEKPGQVFPPEDSDAG